MPLTTPFLAGAAPVQSSARPVERNSNQQTSETGSFGEALSRASQSKDELALEPQGRVPATTATTTTTARRSGKPEEEPEKPDGTDLVAGLALVMLNSRNSPLVARSAGTGTEPGITAQGTAAAPAGALARHADGLMKELDTPVGTDLVSSLGLAVPGSSAASLVSGNTLETGADGQTPQPAATDTLVQHLKAFSSTAQDAATLYGTDTTTGTKGTIEPALLAELTVPVDTAQTANLRTVADALTPASPAPDAAELTVAIDRQHGRSAPTARKEVNALLTTPDTAQTATPRTAADALTPASPAQDHVDLPAAVTIGANIGREKTMSPQAQVNSLAGRAGNQSQLQPQSEILIPSPSTSRFTESGVDAAAATTLMGAAGAMPARFEVATGTMASTATGTTTDVVPVLPQNIGSTDWGKALGQHVLHMGRTGQETAELQLNPPGLGPLKISLSMSEQQIQAAFVSSHASVRAAVEAALPQLRAAMADGGISLGETSVGSQSQQPADTRQGQDGRPGQRSDPDRPARELAATIQRAAEPRRQINGNSVDIYA